LGGNLNPFYLLFKKFLGRKLKGKKGLTLKFGTSLFLGLNFGAFGRFLKGEELVPGKGGSQLLFNFLRGKAEL